ncbi:MAG: restriction endonuclease [Cytophagia bacterium]|nr:restriction endonuclease [Cytophagia bacterium]
MGRIFFPLRDFYDSTIEYVGIKSGLLLSRFRTRDILLKKFKEEFLINDELDGFVRIRSEHIMDMVIFIRKQIGNLPQKLPSVDAWRRIHDFIELNGPIDIMFIGSISSVTSRAINENPGISCLELSAVLEKRHNYPKEISKDVAIVGMETYDQNIVIPDKLDWDGGSNLSDLFDCEVPSEAGHDFIDQKFLDYLAINGHEIEAIHWRNFERFCAEYFKRQGYSVQLGPGKNDGGVDVRVFNPDKAEKPLILVQCKRYKKENKVSIETVKSFYSDVIFEGAEKGLIVTSSYIAPGGAKIRDSRSYNLDFAEHDKVKQWAKNMWKYNK